MTDHEEFDLHDPVVAKEFEVLDRAAVPDLNLRRTETVATGPALAFQPESGRRLAFLGVAATFVMLAAFGLFAVTRDSSPGERGSTQADQTSDDEVALEADIDRSTPPVEATATLPALPPTAKTDEVEATSTTLSEADIEKEQTMSTGTRPEVEDPQDPGDSAVTTVADEPETPITPIETTATEPPYTGPETTVEITVAVTTIPEDDPEPATITSRFTNDPNAVSFSGLVTEVFTDCATHLVLNDAGEPESVGPITCDGGSYVVVAGRRVQTSAGYVATGYYDRHPNDLKPGVHAAVVAVPSEYNDSTLSLDCADCDIAFYID